MKRIVKNVFCLLSVLAISLVDVAHGNAFDVVETDIEYTVNILCNQYTISGIHYQPEPDTGKPLLVLVHGATYGKWMWDVPDYSWIDHFAVDLGYPILAVDRLGYGDSSHPYGDILTPRIQVYTLKQMLDQLRQSESQRPIIMVGHSLGGLFGNMIAGESDLLEGLITIGWIHGEATSVGPSVSAILTGDYVTWTDEERATAFYHDEGADSEIIAYDNLREEPMPRGALWSGIIPDKFVIGLIDVPVFLAAGQYDALWEEVDMAAEAALFTNASVATYLQENAGHTNLLHLSHSLFLDEVDVWLETYF